MEKHWEREKLVPADSGKNFRHKDKNCQEVESLLICHAVDILFARRLPKLANKHCVEFFSSRVVVAQWCASRSRCCGFKPPLAMHFLFSFFLSNVSSSRCLEKVQFYYWVFHSKIFLAVQLEANQSKRVRNEPQKSFWAQWWKTEGVLKEIQNTCSVQI